MGLFPRVRSTKVRREWRLSATPCGQSRDRFKQFRPNVYRIGLSNLTLEYGHLRLTEDR